MHLYMIESHVFYTVTLLHSSGCTSGASSRNAMIKCTLYTYHLIHDRATWAVCLASIQMRWHWWCVKGSRVSIWFSNELKCGFIFRTGTPLRGNTTTNTLSLVDSIGISHFKRLHIRLLLASLVQVSLVSHSNFRNPLVCSTILTIDLDKDYHYSYTTVY
jgi:hypothetical protein